MASNYQHIPIRFKRDYPSSLQVVMSASHIDDPTWGDSTHIKILQSALGSSFDHVLASNDIKRFSTLHSWYKHLPRKSNHNNNNDLHEGDVFYPVPMVGYQNRNSFEMLKCDGKIHWHFLSPNEMIHFQSQIGSLRFIASLSHPVYLDNTFGNTYCPGDGQERLADACKQIWESLEFQTKRLASFKK